MPTKLERWKAHRVHWSFFNPPPKGTNLHRSMATYLRHLDLTLKADFDDVGDEQAGAGKTCRVWESTSYYYGLGDSALGLWRLEYLFGHGPYGTRHKCSSHVGRIGKNDDLEEPLLIGATCSHDLGILHVRLPCTAYRDSESHQMDKCVAG